MIKYAKSKGTKIYEGHENFFNHESPPTGGLLEVGSKSSK